MIRNDFNWLAEEGAKLHDKYAGKWIAVHDDQVVGVGETAVEAAEQAQKVAKDGD